MLMTISTTQLSVHCQRKPSHWSFAAKVKNQRGPVSTTCGSGWVNDPHRRIPIDFEFLGLTHPLPQVVLTWLRFDNCL